MKSPIDPFATVVGALVAAAMLVACDMPECIDGPSNLTPKATASCVAPPEDTTPETQIVSAGAEMLDDGTLVLTWSSWGLECGTQAIDVPLPTDCQSTGWALTAEIPPGLVPAAPDPEADPEADPEVDPGTLASTGLIDLGEHPEIRGTLTVTNGGDGGTRGSIGDEPFFVGSLELVEVGEGCVTGVLHGFGTGDPDPTLGGPELNGSFMAPRC